MSRSVFVAVSAVVMLVLALVVVRLFRDPAPVSTTAVTSPLETGLTGAKSEAPSVSAPLSQDAPPALPPASALVMSSGDNVASSNASPMGNGETLPISAAAPVSGDAPEQSAVLARDSNPSSAFVTEPPKNMPKDMPKVEPKAAANESAMPEVATPGVNQKPSKPETKASAQGAAVKDPAKSELDAPAVTKELTKEKDAAKDAPQAEAKVPATQLKKNDAPADKPAETVKPVEKAASAEKSGTLVTKSSLSAKAGVATVLASTLTMDGDAVTLRLEGSQAIKAKTFMLKGPDRVVLDMAGKWTVEAPRVPSNRMLGALRVGNQAEATRLVFDMKVAPGKVAVSQISPNVVELTIR